jgi:hypothetical protein
LDCLPLFLRSWDTLKSLADFGSVIFGILGTWLMSRRYARSLWRNLLFAFIFPILYLVGQGEHVREFVRTTINNNRDIEDSVIDMTIGLNLLFWAFFLQLIALVVEALTQHVG